MQVDKISKINKSAGWNKAVQVEIFENLLQGVLAHRDFVYRGFAHRGFFPSFKSFFIAT